jgi:hypothetical protein
MFATHLLVGWGRQRRTIFLIKTPQDPLVPTAVRRSGLKNILLIYMALRGFSSGLLV